MWSVYGIMLEINKIIQGDCLEVLSAFPDNCIDFIITSPPYADNRKSTYGGSPPEKYIEWFLPISEQLQRVLKPNGSFILNIKEKVVDGERHTYVIELILELIKQRWLWIEEYIWYKKNSFPGEYNGRLRDAWERCLHFTKDKEFKIFKESVMVPKGDWANSRFKKLDKRTGLYVDKSLEELSTNDKMTNHPATGSGMRRNISNWKDKELVYPDNVLYTATECSNQGHPAVFPIELPKWFIRLFTEVNDLVLDPFMGSGTTAVAAKLLKRNYIGIELKQSYIDGALKRLNKTRSPLYAK